MTNDHTAVRDLLRSLVASFVSRPEEIQIATQLAEDGACFFALKVAREDESKIVGAGGSHVDALNLLVRAFGAARSRAFTFRAITPGPPLAQKLPARDVLEHDPRPALALLNSTLGALDHHANVGVGPGSGPRNTLTFVFRIAAGADAYDALTAPFNGSGCTIIAAIGTLFRAIAKKNGVNYVISVIKDDRQRD